ncbi:MAG: twin-arginine translocase TatA/TatE family subunit [Planctomycetaceae bacterium]|nr:twin-arginine translocase TatA/TatE family subunit [Planctomycetaceae bacterium]
MIAGPWQMLIVLAIILLLFGGKRIPQAMRSLGQSITEFKKGIKEPEAEDRPDSNADSDPPTPS